MGRSCLAPTRAPTPASPPSASRSVAERARQAAEGDRGNTTRTSKSGVMERGTGRSGASRAGAETVRRMTFCPVVIVGLRVSRVLFRLPWGAASAGGPTLEAPWPAIMTSPITTTTKIYRAASEFSTKLRAAVSFGAFRISAPPPPPETTGYAPDSPRAGEHSAPVVAIARARPRHLFLVRPTQRAGP